MRTLRLIRLVLGRLCMERCIHDLVDGKVEMLLLSGVFTSKEQRESFSSSGR